MSARRANTLGRTLPAGDGHEELQQLTSSTAVIRQSMAGAIGTVVSRLTGLAKIIVVGAVLGATYLGNTYQAINSLPNLVYYSLLAGSLFVSVLVPPLVHHVDHGDPQDARRFANGFLGSVLLIAVLGSAILLALGPLITRLLTFGVPDAATATAERHIGWLLLVMFVPQIVLYVVAGTGAAVMNARGRFGLAAAAPALESLGIIAVLVSVGILFGTGIGILDISEQEVILLGLGTTAAVGLHAACQWWGARSSGLMLLPGAGWRDTEVRRILRRIVPSLGFTALSALEFFVLIVVANRVAGGLVAFQLALNFFYLPTALVTWPTGRALLPQLARLHHAGNGRGFRDELLRAMAVASFVTVPIAVLYIAIAGLLGRVLAFGQLQQGAGPALFALSLASLAPGVVAETWFTLGTYAFYAQQDVRSPLHSMAVRVAVSLSCMAVAWQAHGSTMVVVLGLSVSLGSLVGAAYVSWRLRGRLPRTELSVLRPMVQTVVASLVMVGPVYLTIFALHGLPSTKPGQLLVMAAASLVGIAVFLAIQVVWRTPVLAWLKGALLPGRLRSDPPR